MKTYVLWLVFVLLPVLSGAQTQQPRTGGGGGAGGNVEVTDGNAAGEADVVNTAPGASLYGLVTRPIGNDQVFSGTLNSATPLTFDIDGAGMATWDYRPTSLKCNLGVKFYGSVNGTDFQLIPHTPYSTGLAVIGPWQTSLSVGAATVVISPASGFQKLRALCDDFISGSAAITLRVSTASSISTTTDNTLVQQGPGIGTPSLGWYVRVADDLGDPLYIENNAARVYTRELVNSSVVLDTANEKLNMSLSGRPTALINITAISSPVLSLCAEAANNVATAFVPTSFILADGIIADSLLNPVQGLYGIVVPEGTSIIGVRVCSYTSGSVTANIEATVAAGAIQAILSEARTIPTSTHGSFPAYLIGGEGPSGEMRRVRVLLGTPSAGTQGLVVRPFQATDGTNLTPTMDADARRGFQEVSRWLGSTAPTVGQKTMAASLPVVLSSDHTSLSTKTALTFNSPTFATVGVASAQALASNAIRKGGIFKNTSNNKISCAVGATAVLDSGITLEAGDVWNMNEYSFGTGAVNCIASAAGSNLSIQEMQ